MKIRKDITGQKFGLLTAIKPIEKGKNGTKWLCQCECGNFHTTTVTYLLNGDCKSCGCYKYEPFKEMITKHGMTGTRIYSIWNSMRNRCNNPNALRYKDYGGRGIKCCEEWNDFKEFLKWANSNGYKDDLTLDRIDNNKSYCPDNCRWVTMEQQQYNKRTTHYLTYNGETKSMAEWAKEKNMCFQTLAARINNYNWTVEQALETPVKPSNEGVN